MIHEVTYYQAKCDGCGTVEDDYGDYTAFGDPGTVIDHVLDADWFRKVAADGAETLLCPECQRCEVCESKHAYPVDDHLVCEDHEDHDFPAVGS